MKAITPAPTPIAPLGGPPLAVDALPLRVAGRPATRSRFVAYAELTKPRIALMVLFTVVIGAVLATGGQIDPLLLLHTVLGTCLVAAGASALNMYLERRLDARMRRTENRPLPPGRLRPPEALLFGSALGLVGTAYLALALPHIGAALVAAVTFVTYVFVYTPLKRITPLNTLVGAVPGALPPLIGWTAMRGTIDVEAAGLFLIVFFWQVPHFLAIAWIHREDYARGGFRMLPAVDPDGSQTGRNMALYCLALIPASLLPALGGHAGMVYVAGAVVLGAGFFACTVGFLRAPSVGRARRVLRGSLLYLPAVLALLLVDALVLRF
jgi:protoheme IX farnesyltransferase